MFFLPSTKQILSNLAPCVSCILLSNSLGNPSLQYHDISAEREHNLDSHVSSTCLKCNTFLSTFTLVCQSTFLQAQQKNMPMGCACQRSYDGIWRTLGTRQHRNTHRRRQVHAIAFIACAFHLTLRGGVLPQLRMTKKCALPSYLLLLYVFDLPFVAGTYGSLAFP